MPMTRRQFLANSAWISGGVLLAPRTLGGLTERTKAPNIVYILADDLGYGDLGCYGQQKIRTPHIDRLAAEGLRFTDHYSGSAVCAPSRCSLMTGLHTGHTRIRKNGDGSLAAEDATMAQTLKQAGYATGCVGKWGLGQADEPGAPWRKGFDQFFGFLDQTAAHAQYPKELFRNADRVSAEGRYANDLFAEEALQFVRQHREQPFFLYWASTIPHAELLVPEDSLAEYTALGWPETAHPGGHYAAQPTPNAARAAMITRLDRDVGRLVAVLKELGLEEQTLVVFTSDNGPAVAGGADPKFFQSAGPLSGLKFTLSEGGIRVPMVARWPGHVPAGATTAHPSAFWDVPATLAELADVASAQPTDGVSFLPTLCGKPQQPSPAALYWEFGKQRAVRFGQWKAIQIEGKPLEMFDLSADVAEAHNCAAAHPDIVAQAERHLAACHADPPAESAAGA